MARSRSSCARSRSKQRWIWVSAPSPSRSTLKRPRSSTSYLSHWMTVRSSIVAGSMGTSSSTGSAPSKNPPGWIERCRGKSCDLVARAPRAGGRGSGSGRGRPARARSPRSDRPSRRGACSRDRGRSRAARAPCPRRGRRSGPVADHVGDHRRAPPAPARVDVLDDLLAALVLDVEIDVRRLGALAAQEALEEQIHPHRVDGGDAEAVADGAVGGAAAALTEDALASGRTGRCPTSSGSSRRSRAPRSVSSSRVELRAHVVGDGAAVALASRRERSGCVSQLCSLSPSGRCSVG